MKIVYSIPSSVGAGGLGVHGFEAMKGIFARGYLEKVVCYRNRQNEVPARYIRPMRFYATKVFSNLPARYYYPVKMKSLDRLTVRILRKGADLFHGWSGSSLRSLRYCRERGIVSFMENAAPHFRVGEAIVGAEYESLGIRWKKDPEVFRRFFEVGADHLQEEYDTANYILLESAFTRDTFLSQGIPEEKLVVVPPGVDTVRFRPPQTPRPKRPFRVIFIGALQVRKGVHHLIKAWSELSLRDAELILIGTVHDDLRPLLLERRRKRNDIRVMGFVQEPVRLYQEGSVFVLPSLSEGSAKVTHEAMASGLPVIVTPNAGSVARDEQDGFLIPPRDLEALQEKLLLLYEQPELRDHMGRNARRHIEAFTWDAHRAYLLAAYEAAFRKTGGA